LILAAAANLALIVLTATLLCALYRLVRGPSLPDRVVALDLISVTTVGIVAVNTIKTGFRVYLDVAIVIGLLSFLGTIAFARYLQMREGS
jgi:multicomponent Na+:H+ antiporter subunit F